MTTTLETPFHHAAVANLAAIAAALRALALSRITVNYHGCEDERESNEYHAAATEDATAPAVPLPDTEIDMVVVRQERGEASMQVTRQRLRLRKACATLLNQVLVCADHERFAHDDGGGGDLIIRADGTLTLNHYDMTLQREEAEPWHLPHAPSNTEQAPPATAVASNEHPPGMSYWGEDPNPAYALERWRDEVANNDTRRGYWDWVAKEKEADAHDAASEEVQ